MSKFDLARARELQSRVDRANSELTAARVAGASSNRIAELTADVTAAQARIHQEIAAADDPMTAAGWAKHAAEDRSRPGKPASVGERLVQVAAQRAEARRARQNAA
jgi:hypothetical protein